MNVERDADVRRQALIEKVVHDCRTNQLSRQNIRSSSPEQIKQLRNHNFLPPKLVDNKF